MKCSSSTRIPGGFSLIEVVLATGVFAVAILAVVGLLAPGQRQVAQIQDAAIASRLADAVRSELKNYDFDVIANRFASTGTPFELVANRELTLVRSLTPINLSLRLQKGGLTSDYLMTGAITANARAAGSIDPAKPNGSIPTTSFDRFVKSSPSGPNFSATTEPILAPGIPSRDRYFLIRITAATEPPAPTSAQVAAAASLPLKITIYYPFQVPAGAATDGVAETVGLGSDAAIPDVAPGGETTSSFTRNGGVWVRTAANQQELDAYLAKLTQFTFNFSMTR